LRVKKSVSNVSTSPFKRVVVIGCSGSGKSTFARRLGALTGLPVTHIDHLFWQPGWKQTPKNLYIERLSAIVAKDQWIIEGVNSSTLDLRLPRTDLLIWLQRNRLACLWRVARRVAASFGRVRPDMAPGCPEQLPDLEFLTYIWTFGARIAPQIEAAIARHDMQARTIRFRSDRAAESWLTTLSTDITNS
jgi:adenylate kinase family enzyme